MKIKKLPDVKSQKQPQEEFEFNFWGIKFNSKNPGKQTFILLIIFIAFILALAIIFSFWIKANVWSITAIAAGSGIKARFWKIINKIRSP